MRSTLITKHVVESGISRLVAGRTSLIKKQNSDILGTEFCVCVCVCVCACAHVGKGVSVCMHCVWLMCVCAVCESWIVCV